MDKPTFWQYIKCTRKFRFTENELFDISVKDKKKILVINLAGYCTALAVVVYICTVITFIKLEFPYYILIFGFMILCYFVQLLITLPFHRKLYKNINITAYNKHPLGR